MTRGRTIALLVIIVIQLGGIAYQCWSAWEMADNVRLARFRAWEASAEALYWQEIAKTMQADWLVCRSMRQAEWR